MQLGDLESQAVPAPDQPSTANACDEPKSDVTSSISVSAALPNAKSSGWRSHQARLQVAWRLMRKKRREVSAMIVLILMAILWLDTGGAGSQGATSVPDPLEGYDVLLGDFESAGSARPQRESAEPLDFSSETQSGSDSLYIPQSNETAAASQSTGRFGEPARAAAANYSNETPAFSSLSDRKADEPGRRKVRFAGRIQPAN